MPKYVIERELAGAGELTPEELQGISQKFCSVLEKLGPKIQWLNSYVTDDKIYCVYLAPDAAMVLEHATQGGLPADRVSTVKAVINPTTAGARPRQENQRLVRGLTVALALMIVAFLALKDLPWFRSGPLAQKTHGEEQPSLLAWQSHLWKEGFSAGERHVESGGKPLDRDAINQKASAKFPANFTADVLWSIGFESGQTHAIRENERNARPTGI